MADSQLVPASITALRRSGEQDDMPDCLFQVRQLGAPLPNSRLEIFVGDIYHPPDLYLVETIEMLRQGYGDAYREPLEVLIDREVFSHDESQERRYEHVYAALLRLHEVWRAQSREDRGYGYLNDMDQR